LTLILGVEWSISFSISDFPFFICHCRNQLLVELEISGFAIVRSLESGLVCPAAGTQVSFLNGADRFDLNGEEHRADRLEMKNDKWKIENGKFIPTHRC
jgi:hypothetical protein